jgi:hypothetical protein
MLNKSGGDVHQFLWGKFNPGRENDGELSGRHGHGFAACIPYKIYLRHPNLIVK